MALSNSQRQRIFDFFWQGQTIEQIAAAFGLAGSEGDVQAVLADTTLTPTYGSTGPSDLSVDTVETTGAITAGGAVGAASLSVAGTTIAASTGNTDVNGTLGVDGAATFDGIVTVGGELQGQAAELEHGLGVFGTEPPAAAASITGALLSVTDAAAKNVLSALVAALVATGQAVDNTT